MKPAVLGLFTVVVFAGVVSGCSGTDPGRPGPESTVESRVDTTSGGPPFPQSERDPSRFNDRPCDLLTSAQLAGLGEFKAPEVEDTAIGPACHWRAQDTLKGTRYDATIYTDGSTIESISESVEGSPVVRKTTISGYPAVSFDITDGQGRCSTAVGTSPRHAILVQVIAKEESSPEWRDSCGASEKVAAFILENLKG